MRSKTVNVLIDRDWRKVYAFVANPENLVKWAKTFCRSVKKVGEAWVIETPQGPVQARFSPKNDFGVLDHYLVLPPGPEVFVPMRMVPNGAGCEVIFTIFQQQGMSDESFLKDESLVRQDLTTLKTIMEQRSGE